MGSEQFSPKQSDKITGEMSSVKDAVIFEGMLEKYTVWKDLRVLLLKDGEGQGSTQVFKCPLAKLLVPESFIPLWAQLPPGRGASLQALLPAVAGLDSPVLGCLWCYLTELCFWVG